MANYHSLKPKWPFLGEHGNHKGWTASIPYLYFNMIFMGMNPWKFGQKQFTKIILVHSKKDQTKHKNVNEMCILRLLNDSANSLSIQILSRDCALEFVQNFYWINGILLLKLYRPTVRKNCSSDRGWRPRIFKIFEITRTIYSNSERSEQFLVTECFFNLFLEVSHI